MSDLDDALSERSGRTLLVFDVEGSARFQDLQLREAGVDGHRDVLSKALESGETVTGKAVGVGRIRKNVDQAIEALKDAFSSSAGKTIGDLELDEIEVGLEISSDGKVGILGIGVGVSGSSSIKVTFKRRATHA